MHKLETIEGELLYSDSVLTGLQLAGVVYFGTYGASFVLTGVDDDANSICLTPNQLAALGRELIEISGVRTHNGEVCIECGSEYSTRCDNCEFLHITNDGC